MTTKTTVPKQEPNYAVISIGYNNLVIPAKLVATLSPILEIAEELDDSDYYNKIITPIKQNKIKISYISSIDYKELKLNGILEDA